MRALVTNDDGVDSVGILTLARVAAEAGLDVVVAAPGWDTSGASASLTAVERDGRFLFSEREMAGLEGVPVFAVEGAPAFIVRTAMTGAFGPRPDIVLSGVNHGPNTGHAILHSGTVGAALTAETHGCRAMAVSICAAGEDTHWETAAAVVASVLPWLFETDGTAVINVNVPNCSLDELKGLERARLASFGAVQTTITETGKGWVKLAHEDVDADHEPGTDAALIAMGYACYTPLVSVCEADGVDTSSISDQPRRICI